MSLIDTLQWRYATKKYDTTKKVDEADVQKIVEAARLAPTSSGLQQFRVLVITNQEIKEKLVDVSFGQEIVKDCSHLLVFASWDKYTEERIDSAFDFATDVRELPRGRFNSYTDKLKSIYLPQSQEENFIHTAKQAYIGMAMSIAQAAELKIDATPMEGFENDKLDEILGLKIKGLSSVLMLPIGYRDEGNDWNASLNKVRIPTEEFVLEIK
ncbi:NAD(P)H-dependent oxidoreductase [Faecalibacter macacae]|uniref:NAD(P)H-dependent oxidoreductase n=1 Tax=Faecalibacter macacae TaxID=1859289 RepID=A0A3L9MFA4_9FLAO|nr:NAD(P)H-dependent oxidoreductase [Faecalibacter macacae]RLZ11505.1 NAD(P)H-dependent oxidoreductase [Faecalibacter macacae]